MEKYIFALGFFDGVHLGHQALLATCLQLANQAGAKAAAITFQNHPLSAFTSEYPPCLSTLADRENLMVHYGIERVVPLDTTKDVMSTSWEDFLASLVTMGAVGFVCGDDFHFGAQGQGDIQKLVAWCAEKGLPCVIVPEQTLEGRRISSTHIRSLLEGGDLAGAERFLGHRHIFTGPVVHGKGLGRTLGTPTANLAVPHRLILPKNGVYACKAFVDGQEFLAVTNIGSRPTVGGHHITVEPWLLNFSGDLYGKEVTLEFHAFLRPERKFANLEELQAEILKNAQETKRMLSS